MLIIIYRPHFRLGDSRCEFLARLGRVIVFPIRRRRRHRNVQDKLHFLSTICTYYRAEAKMLFLRWARLPGYQFCAPFLTSLLQLPGRIKKVQYLAASVRKRENSFFGRTVVHFISLSVLLAQSPPPARRPRPPRGWGVDE